MVSETPGDEHPPEPDPLGDPRAELRLVEQELAEAERDADELRRQIGDPAGEDSEPEDRANLITSLETQKALVEGFRARAAALRQRLGRD